MKAEITDEGGAMILNLSGNFEPTTAGDFKKHIEALSKSCDKDIIVNMKEVDYIDSSGIGLLIKLYKAQKNRGNKIKVINSNSRVSEILSLSSLSDVLE